MLPSFQSTWCPPRSLPISRRSFSFIIYMDTPPPDWKDFNLKATITGIRNQQVTPSNQKDPLLPKHLARIAKHVDFDSRIQRLVWAAICFLFRTLLRVSHVVSSPHTLKSKDVVFTNWFFFVRVCSSKTRKSSQKP